MSEVYKDLRRWLDENSPGLRRLSISVEWVESDQSGFIDLISEAVLARVTYWVETGNADWEILDTSSGQTIYWHNSPIAGKDDFERWYRLIATAVSPQAPEAGPPS